jgi:hypothetical protein
VNTLDIKKRGAQADVHPSALFAHTFVNTDALADALLRIADDVVQHGICSRSRYKAARELLLRRPPRLASGAFEMHGGETPAQFAIRNAAQLDDTALAIQGPPGSGKTYTGARMIRELVRNGARVGVTALSHKVIANLLREVMQAAAECGINFACAQLTPDETTPGVEKITKNDAVLARLRNREANVVGGTAWLWADPKALSSVDVLFVDEAGQMPLANVLAASQVGGSVVLLGDPQQLDQP